RDNGANFRSRQVLPRSWPNNQLIKSVRKKRGLAPSLRGACPLLVRALYGVRAAGKQCLHAFLHHTVPVPSCRAIWEKLFRGGRVLSVRESLTRQHVGRFPLIDCQPAIDEQIANARGILVGLVEGGPISIRFRVEYDHVREI